MKILKPGRPQEGWSTSATCTGNGNGAGGCKAKLLIEQPDLFKTFRHCRDETDVFVTFKCEACGVLTDLHVEPPRNVIAQLPDQATWEKRREDAL